MQRLSEKQAAIAKDVGVLYTLFNGWKAEEAATQGKQDTAMIDQLDKSSTLGCYRRIALLVPADG